MSNYKSLNKKEKNWTLQCLILNHFKLKEKNWTWQCLILYHRIKTEKIGHYNV